MRSIFGANGCRKGTAALENFALLGVWLSPQPATGLDYWYVSVNGVDDLQ